MGLYEELSQTFPSESIHPYGVVVIVPKEVFKGEWESQLKAEGVQIYTNSFNGRVCFFLRKKNSESSEAQPTPIQNQPKELKPIKRFSWSKEDLERLRQMREQGLSLETIAEKLGKNKGSVMAKLRVLKKLNEPLSSLKPKSEAVNCEVDLVGEIIQALMLLYPKHKRIAKFILENSSNLLKDE